LYFILQFYYYYYYYYLLLLFIIIIFYYYYLLLLLLLLLFIIIIIIIRHPLKAFTLPSTQGIHILQGPSGQACLPPSSAPGFHAAIFPCDLFTVSLDGLSKTGTTHSLQYN